MKEILLTSSVLIAALLLLRRVFRRSVSRRVQYALWALVLVRLLVPANLPALDHNVLTAVDPVVQDIEALYITPHQIVYDTPSGANIYGPPNTPAVTVGPATPDNKLTFSVEDAFHTPVEATTLYQRQIVLEDLLRPVWYAGMAFMAVWFFFSNLLFWWRLRRRRTPYAAENCTRRVYLVEEGLPSPCLFGLFRPAIYLTPAAVSSPEALRHVLAHEETHARHRDPLWSLLRAVCLTVYWFDPLVWAAALASKNDCELACDEGAILRLGEAERIPYGRTLLSLIPVRRGPSNPLLSATTMTAGKKQLKDRVTRIAQSRRTVGIALFAVLAIAAAVCAATFTGAASKAPDKTGSARADGPLTGQELRYFNLDFFNGTDVYGNETMNIRNQFLASTYERPEDVGLLEIFYSGIPYGEIDVEADLSAGWEVLRGRDGWFEPDCPMYALSTAEMDALLMKYTGLTVAETGQTDFLQDMGTYLPEYDAYYWAHGDTLYRGQVEITAGEREGDLVRLYYQDYWSGGIGGAWMCATLRELEDGGYHFVSNLPCEAPVIPTAYPAGEPWRAIPLTDLPDHSMEVIPLARHSMDCAQRGGGWMVNGGTTDGRSTELSFRPYRSTDGNFYAAVIRDEAAGRDGPIVWEADVFLTMSPINSLEWGETTISFQYAGVIGGRYIYELSYLDKEGVYPVSVYDYYFFQDDGTPVLLHRTRYGDNRFFDLNGDGVDELVCVGRYGAQILFEDPNSPGVLRLADIGQLLSGVWPQMDDWDLAELDTFDRCLRVRGYVNMPEWGDDARADFQRAIYFTPENLLVYTNLTDTEAHMAVDAGDSVPEEIRRDALLQANLAYEQVRVTADAQDARYDDWRVSALSLTGAYTDLPVEGTLEVYSVGWQLHAGTPAGVPLAGGVFVQEDGWAGGFSTGGSPYLIYLLRENGTRQRVESLLTYGYAENSQFFRVDLCRSAVQGGLAKTEDLEGRDLYYMFYANPFTFLNDLESTPPLTQQSIFETLMTYADNCSTDEASLMGDALDSLNWNPADLTEAGRAAYARLLEQPAAGALFQGLMDALLAEETVLLELDTDGAPGGGMYEVSTAKGNGPGIARDIRSDFRWSRVDTDWPGQGRSLRISDLRDRWVLEFWEDSGLVRCSGRDGTVFYQTEPADPEDIFVNDIFECMRIWFDEAEYDALSEDIVIPDRDQSHLEIAQEWSERATAVNLRLTPGSILACTFVRAAADVERWSDMPETSYPGYTAGRNRFYFSYTRVFVPENERSLHEQMAGNTGGYTGSDPDVPEGAFENFQVGVLYLTEDGWRCDGTGTGP